MKKILGEFFKIEYYVQLNPVIKTHYNKKLILMLFMLIASIGCLLFFSIKKSAAVMLVITILLIVETIWEIKDFQKGKVNKLIGICSLVRKDDSYAKAELKRLGTNVLFGKYSIYIKADGKTYEIFVPNNRIFEKDALVCVWYQSGTFTRSDGVVLIHDPYIVCRVTGNDLEDYFV